MRKWLIYFMTCCVLASCGSDKEEGFTPLAEKDPQLTSVTFYMKDNPLQLTEDIRGEIIGDSVVECRIPNISTKKDLIPQIAYQGEKLLLNGIPYDSKAAFDFKKPVTLNISSGEKTKTYTIYVHSFTGLPIVWIETEGRKDITSKDEYQRASFRLVENIRTRAAGDITEDSLSIKGRGNTTWDLMPKKSYRLKLDRKHPLLDDPADKSWVLLNNYADKTMLRTKTAFYMGEISCLDYTPSSHFVEVMLNGKYNGTYLLCEKLKIDKSRVNVGNDGFLLEIDAKATPEDITFEVDHIENPINIKKPDDIIGEDTNYSYVVNFVQTADNVLFSENFRDPNEGWQKYIDINSFADWYLINEIAKNNDAIFHTSCYMNLSRKGKLKMGPLWDYDIAFGNVNYNENYQTDQFWVKHASWYNRLFQDSAFVAKVKERFGYFYSRKADIMRNINEHANYLRYAVQENENRWHTFYTYTWPNYNIWGSYNSEVQSLKEWLDERFEWLKIALEKM